MTAIDRAIFDTNINICKNISNINFSERGFISQNILSQMRNFVEYIAMKLCSDTPNIDPNDYNLRVKLLNKLKTRGDLRFLSKFHDLLQKSVSHYTLDENASERLMLKYYEYLLKIKLYLKENFDFSVLYNIEQFPINTDKDLYEFYKKISEKIEKIPSSSEQLICNDRLYIQKNKPFFVNEKIYYEVTFTLATDNVSKFDRVIAFTNLNIIDNYAVYFTIHKDTILIINNEMEINIIDSWVPAIRPCELDHFTFIFSGNKKRNRTPKATDELMKFIYKSNMTLLELIESTDDFYTNIKNKITTISKNSALFEIFDICRDIVLNNKPGSNILRYLLYSMNNTILKKQINWNTRCEKLSNLYLDYGTIPFDQMPFITSLIGHNPRIFDLLECIPIVNHEDEFLARFVKTNTERNNVLFTKVKELDRFKNIDDLIKLYNQKLYYKHVKTRSLRKFSDSIYINEYADDCSEIVKKFKELTTAGVKGYTSFVHTWLKDNPDKIDDEAKKQALLQMFSDSHIAFIYGSAGTGKSTLIKHISELFAHYKKIYLANTNPAVENLRRKITVSNCSYMTVAKFLYPKNTNTDCVILFIDESSTLCNADMRKVLDKAQFKLLVLVGDIYQIEAIQFGNWFSIAKQFMPKTSVFELENTFRSTDEKLKTVWSRVRNLEDSMQEAIEKFGYSKRLDNSIFEKINKDEIILCLNYDGLYGINNINSFLQNNNPNKSVIFGVHTYKIGDPILFNESNRFFPVIYNNMKGIIIDIEDNENSILFTIEINSVLSELDVFGFELLDNSKNGKSVIRFSIDKKIDTDSDNTTSVMPFQIAYAISIHKAQGLEYDSVKIIVSDEVEERITHNIFYTAITRARRNLNIYWSPEVEHNVLTNLKKKNDSNRDANILKTLYSL